MNRVCFIIRAIIPHNNSFFLTSLRFAYSFSNKLKILGLMRFKIISLVSVKLRMRLMKKGNKGELGEYARLR